MIFDNSVGVLNHLLGCRCQICNHPIGFSEINQLLCQKCWQLMPIFNHLIENSCRVCALPIVNELKVCKYCEIGDLKYLDQTIAGYIYDFPVRNLILQLKTNPNNAIVKLLVNHLTKSIIDQPGFSWSMIDEIIPMPIHNKRLQFRGFNQSILLARNLAQKAGKPININLVNKIRDNGVQEGRSRIERFRKIKNSFKVTKNCGGKNYLLLDDVLTTGASINELARVLKKQGANFCAALVVCRASF